ncbi:CDP-glycerol glycerophosphotransferase family protein [Lactococcus formosensis]|uniref:CDP-glycerol glycerophosphotransferase family protein n=1 Tax=Lactococcus formosensis TaxID=1281486 RepID=UPI002097CDC9|nr:CDP-glycerol glycerophosphotransferase family protein [Lactococcus formosensis]MCO7180145.1 CDP-glycerol glycerophosphotransferase family protein [Lactococcus formosensis]
MTLRQEFRKRVPKEQRAVLKKVLFIQGEDKSAKNNKKIEKVNINKIKINSNLINLQLDFSREIDDFVLFLDKTKEKVSLPFILEEDILMFRSNVFSKLKTGNYTLYLVSRQKIYVLSSTSDKLKKEEAISEEASLYFDKNGFFTLSKKTSHPQTILVGTQQQNKSNNEAAAKLPTVCELEKIECNEKEIKIKLTKDFLQSMTGFGFIESKSKKEIPLPYEIKGKCLVLLNDSLKRVPLGRHMMYLKVKNKRKNIHYAKAEKIEVEDRFIKILSSTYLYFNMHNNLSIISEKATVRKNNPFTFGTTDIEAVFEEDKDNYILQLQEKDYQKITFFSRLDYKNIIIPAQKKDKQNYSIPKDSIREYSNLYIRWEDKEHKKYQQKLVKKYVNYLVGTMNSASYEVKENQFLMKLIIEDGFSDNFSLVIKNRSTLEARSITSLKKTTIEKNKFQIEFQFGEDDLPLAAYTSKDAYDINIFDFYISPKIEEFSAIDMTTRVPFFDNVETEQSIAIDDETTFLLKLYKTANSQLSARIYYMPTEGYNVYLKQKRLYQPGIKKYHEKKIILVSEYPEVAHDTGLAFFKYLQDNHSKEYDIYYILSKNSDEFDNLKGYEKNIVIYKSAQHFELIFKADAVAHSHSSLYAYPLLTDYTDVYRNNVKKLFLQHGIIGVRDLTYLYGKNPMFTNHFIVSSEREKKIIENMGYDSEEVHITGLSRFDRLMEGTDASRTKELSKKVLLMPSWREGADRYTDKEFMQTDFYKNLSSLLNSKKLETLINKLDLEVNLYLHHNFQKFLHLFNSKKVHFIKEGEFLVQDILKNHGVMMTDFSSAALDFALQGRKVLYYQLDNYIQDEEEELSEFFPGKIYWDEKEVIFAIKEAVLNPLLDQDGLRKLDNLYLHRDKGANERIYQVLKKMLEE